MKKVNLEELVTNNYLEAVEESIFRSHFPSIIDGNRPVNMAVLLAISEMSKNTTKPILTTALLGTITGKYHLHRQSSIYKSILKMCYSRLPLIKISSKQGEGDAYDITTGEITDPKYTRVSLTPIGVEFVSSTLISPRTYNYDNTISIPEIYTSMFPNALFQLYWDIAHGVSTFNAPLCPEEVFKAMKFILNNNFTATFEEVCNFIKGFDTESYHTHISTTQNMYSLIEDGDCRTAVLCDIDVDKDFIYVRGTPLGYSYANIAKEIDDIFKYRYSAKSIKKTFKTFIIDSIEKSIKLVKIKYRPVKDASPMDIRMEVYNKTSILKEYCVEFIGLLPDNHRTKRRLHKLSVKEIMVNCLKQGYATRLKYLDMELAKLKEQRELNELFEKMTRESTRVWFKSIIDRTDKEDILFKLANEGDINGLIKGYIGYDVDTVIKDAQIGSLLVKGGLTRDEVSTVFQKSSASILSRLDERATAVAELRAYEHNVITLNNLKKHDEVLKYLSSILDKWCKMPDVQRRSKIFYKDVDTLIKQHREDEMKVDRVRGLAEKNQKFFIWFKDNTIEMKLSLKDISLEGVKAIYCTNLISPVYLLSKDFKYRIDNLALDERISCNILIDDICTGVFTVNTDKYYVFVTNKRRVKRIAGTNLVQHNNKVIGFNLSEGEFVLPPHVSTTRNAVEDKSIEVITKQGIKRLDFTDISLHNLKAYKSLFVNRDVNVIDFRVVDKNTTAGLFETSEGIKYIKYLKDNAYKRNISKETPIILDVDLLGCADDKVAYIEDKFIDNSDEILNKVLDITNEQPIYNIKGNDYIESLNKVNSFEDMISLCQGATTHLKATDLKHFIKFIKIE